VKMRLDVKRQLFARSERVKSVDFHPQEPWILTTLYSGTSPTTTNTFADAANIAEAMSTYGLTRHNRS
jgi:hypothetical protein